MLIRKDMHSYVHWSIFSPIETLWKQPKYPSREYMYVGVCNEILYIKKYCHNKNEILPFATT